MERRPINIRLDPDTIDRLMEIAATLKRERGDYRVGAATVAELIIKEFLERGASLASPTVAESRREYATPKKARRKRQP